MIDRQARVCGGPCPSSTLQPSLLERTTCAHPLFEYVECSCNAGVCAYPCSWRPGFIWSWLLLPLPLLHGAFFTSLRALHTAPGSLWQCAHSAVALYVDTGHCLSAANDCACNATECTAPLPAHPSLQHAYTAPRLVCSNNSLQLMVRGRRGIYILWVFPHIHTGCTHVDANESPGLAPCPLGVHRPPR